VKTVEELGLVQRLRLRWNDWRLLRQLREIRALLVSCGYDHNRANDVVTEIIRTLPVPVLNDLQIVEQQQHRERLVGIWLTNRRGACEAR
jgi:hypothetical protein